MSVALPLPPTDEASAALVVWRRYTVRLAALSLISIALAWPLARTNTSVDGRDPFYVALAWQFAIWGLIDLGFAANGLLGLMSVTRRADRDTEVLRRREKIIGALKLNRILNAVWLAIGFGLLAWGCAAWSPSPFGHGVGVIVQAVLLVLFDRGFLASLLATRPRGT